MEMLLRAAESLRAAELSGVPPRTGKIQKLHVKRKRGVFRCDQCTSVFGLRHNLLRHKRTIHEGKRPFKCNVSGCTASFVQRFDLHTHAASVHDKRKDFSCRICRRAFSQRSNLQTHLRSAHDCVEDNLSSSDSSSSKTEADNDNISGNIDSNIDDDIPVAQLAVRNNLNTLTSAIASCSYATTTSSTMPRPTEDYNHAEQQQGVREERKYRVEDDKENLPRLSQLVEKPPNDNTNSGI